MVSFSDPVVVLGLLALWAVLPGLVYADANRLDNMDAGFWWAVSALAFPFGVVAYACVRFAKWAGEGESEPPRAVPPGTVTPRPPASLLSRRVAAAAREADDTRH